MMPLSLSLETHPLLSIRCVNVCLRMTS